MRVFRAHKPKPAGTRGGAAAPAKPRTGGPQPPEQTTDRKPKEIGGPSGPEPTRYGDWERNGICVDF